MKSYKSSFRVHLTTSVKSCPTCCKIVWTCFTVNALWCFVRCIAHKTVTAVDQDGHKISGKCSSFKSFCGCLFLVRFPHEVFVTAEFQWSGKIMMPTANVLCEGAYENLKPHLFKQCRSVFIQNRLGVEYQLIQTCVYVFATTQESHMLSVNGRDWQ